MAEVKNYPGQMVFGLDIGTRSIVGTVGYRVGERFYVVAQRMREHKTRAMLDGQIHDIIRVGETISEVKKELEEILGRELMDVCIAAAGRVLRTVKTHVDYVFSREKEVTQEDIYALNSMGVEKAYDEFQKDNDLEMKFYCVGYSVIRYYMNGYQIGNLESHKAKEIAADIIATFLPDDVVDGLYKAVEKAGLSVANLTLEPIAAIRVAIPEKFRMLNMALVDVGAGTSDISITKDGSIMAYGMIPTAGDRMTEVIASHCLVDFDTAEQIKKDACAKERVIYKDIMGLEQTAESEEILELIRPEMEDMVGQVGEKIKELNGGKPVSAVFVVGGGGKIPGYTEALAQVLGIVSERVAVRGEEVMQQIEFLEDNVQKDSLLVTPIGICLNFYDQSNNFIFVTFNDKRVKLYDNNKLSVIDAAMQTDFPNDGLFPRRGKELNFRVNGKPRIVRGLPGEAAVITVNGSDADIHTPVHANDVIRVKESTAGEAACLRIGELPEYGAILTVMVNEKRIDLPKFASVNGQLQSEYYDIRENDDIEILNFYTVRQIAEFMDVLVDRKLNVYVNNRKADWDTPVYENFSVIWTMEEPKLSEVEEDSASGQEDGREETGGEEYGREEAGEERNAGEEEGFDESREEEPERENDGEAVDGQQPDDGNGRKVSYTLRKNTVRPSDEQRRDTAEPVEIHVMVNGDMISLGGKAEYVLVDIFEVIDFDLSTPKGLQIVITLNGRPAQYMEPIRSGDNIEVSWKS